LFSSGPYSTDFEIGDLVILLHSVEWMGYRAETGALGIVIRVYSGHTNLRSVYDCRIKLFCGAELDCWFGEIHPLKEANNQ
tara:strand:+ start:457 stop:699 length:243 start_codon:yes stop_codon:yes gene_type:complete